MSNQNQDILTEQELVRRVLGGDHRAFTLIVKNTERLVSQIVFKMIEAPGDRKDIAQDIYHKAFNSLSGFHFQSKLSTWIGQIAYFTCLKHIEKKRPLLLAEIPEQLSTNDDPEALLLQKEAKAGIKAAISLLPPVYQTLVTLFHQEELSYTEIAQITAMPEGTIKSYLSRARKILKEQLLKQYKGEIL